MGFGWILAGLIFLANPLIGLHDILPDVFGYLLIYRGLRNVSAVFPQSASARSAFFVMIWIGLGKSLASLSVLLGGENLLISNMPSLIFTFLFLILEIAFLLPAIRKLFDAISYAGGRCGSSAVDRGLKSLRRFSTWFFVLRAVFPVVPELVALSSYQYSGVVRPGLELDYARFKPLFYVLTLFVMCILSILYLIRILIYFIRIFREKGTESAFSDMLSARIREQPGLFLRRILSVSLLFLTVALFFNADFYAAVNDQSEYYEETDTYVSRIRDWGMVNLVPDILCAVLLITGLSISNRENRNRACLYGSGVLYLASSTWSYITELKFNSEFVMEDVLHWPQAEDLYQPVVLSNFLKGSFFVLFLFCITRHLNRFVSDHTGLIVDHGDKDTSVVMSNELTDLKKSLRTRLWVAFGFGCVSAFASALCVMYLPYSRYLWLLDLLLSFLHACVSLSAFGRLRLEMNTRYA